VLAQTPRSANSITAGRNILLTILVPLRPGLDQASVPRLIDQCLTICARTGSYGTCYASLHQDRTRSLPRDSLSARRDGSGERGEPSRVVRPPTVRFPFSSC